MPYITHDMKTPNASSDEMIKLGSLFDGIGGFPLAGLDFGIVPIWASEIEPFPIRVTKERFPDMQHVGDITKLTGADLPPVDIITGGSPCQDLSVAGKRAGLQGERSGLFMEQVRVIKEARAKFGKPRFMVWENVPGAFSSANGEDFRAVLEETARIAESGVSIPRPADGKWAGAGCIMGDTWSIAWRVLDAQFWGVPQRRRRIFLVADFGGQSAPEILFKSEGVSGDIEASGAQGEGTAEGTEGGAGKAKCYPINTMVGLRGDADDMRTTFGIGEDGEPQFTLQSNHSHAVGTAVAFEPGAIARDMGIRNWEEVAPALRAEAGDNQPAVYCLQGNGIDRADTAGCNGKGWTVDVSYTLNTLDRPAVAPICMAPTFSRRPMQQIATNQEDISYAITTNEPPRVLNTQVAFTPRSVDCRNLYTNDELSGTLQGKPNGGQSLNYQNPVITGTLNPGAHPGSYNGQDAYNDLLIPSPLSVRRLTPLECERLQGFPDGWTDIEKSTDSARYKALGNSVAIPCVKFVLQGIADLQKVQNPGGR